MIKFHSKYTPNCTVVISNFQKFSGEGLTEPLPRPLPRSISGFALGSGFARFSGASRPRFGLRPQFWTPPLSKILDPPLSYISSCLFQSLFFKREQIISVNMSRLFTERMRIEFKSQKKLREEREALERHRRQVLSEIRIPLRRSSNVDAQAPRGEVKTLKLPPISNVFSIHKPSRKNLENILSDSNQKEPMEDDEVNTVLAGKVEQRIEEETDPMAGGTSLNADTYDPDAKQEYGHAKSKQKKKRRKPSMLGFDIVLWFRNSDLSWYCDSIWYCDLIWYSDLNLIQNSDLI